MNRLLLKEELDKLSSTDGIIELLCGIPNFKSDSYDELDSETRELIDYTMSIKLLSDSQINGNLRRSMDAGNLALINHRKLTALSLLYFGIKDENGKYVKYVCPYTGKEYNLEEVRKELNKPYNTRNLDKVLELEHIMPHSRGGGTVLFNCIPASKKANSVAEKGDLHLLDWLANLESSGYRYYENGGAERLNKLVNYMLSAYEISFEEYEESELEFNYDDIGEIEEGIDNDEDLESNDRKIANDKKEKIRKTKIEGYIPFLNQLINQLEREGYDTKDIKNRLVELEEKGVINNLKKYTIVQKTIEELFEKEDSKSYLTYSLNVDYIKLVNSIETNEPEKIKEILTKRFEQIKQLIRESNRSIKDYFLGFRDNVDIDLLYKNNANKEEIKIFVNNIKLGYDGKLNLFIEMLSEDKYTEYKKGVPNKRNIFKYINKEPFKGYENIEGLNTSHFWSGHSIEIKTRIEEKRKKLTIKEELTEEEKTKLEKLKKAERAIDCYEFTANSDRRVDCYIDMLADDEYTRYEKIGKGRVAPNKNNIFGQKNEVFFKGYENIEGLNTSYFWSNNSNKTKVRIEEQTKELESEENLSKEGKNKLERLQKAKRAIDCYEFTLQGNLDRRIDCFIEMLSDGEYTRYEKLGNGKIGPNKKNIFGVKNKISFKGYENIEGLNTSHFWSGHSIEIKTRIEEKRKIITIKEELTEEEKTKLEKLKKAERAIDYYEFTTNIDRRIECFIEMLAENEYTKYENGNPNKKNIFGVKNKISFKGYENIEGLNTSQFWTNNSNEIKARIEEQIKELKSKENLSKEGKNKLERLQKAGKAIDCYEFTTNLDRRIECFIEMLSDGEYTRYEKLGNGKLGPNKKNIFGRNNVQFKGYENIEGLNISQLWTNNSNEIKVKIEKQIKELKSKENLSKEGKNKLERLQKAERAIDFYEFTTNIDRRIDCYIDMLADDEYTRYEKRGKGRIVPNKNNIFGQKNEVFFKGYETIEGLNTSHFWNGNSIEIKTRIVEKRKKLTIKEELTEEEKIELKKLKKAERAIDCYEFITNLDRRIDCYIDMLADDEFTKYENGNPNKKNIFGRNNVQFKGYENIEGLNTSQFWKTNSIKIVSRLFYNTDDKGNKLEKDYSGEEYDKSRNAILEYAKVKSIEEYIDKIKNEEDRNTLNSLRENASDLTISDIEKAGRIIRGILDKDQEIA